MYIKYPRTPHLPWSLGATSDDKWCTDVSTFTDPSNKIVITLKLDGENTTIYPDGYTHARSVTSSRHWSRSQVKALAAYIGPQLPPDWRIVGENLTATHSIDYHGKYPFFNVISLWRKDMCLSWPTTQEWCEELLDLETVPALYDGPGISKEEMEAIYAPYSKDHEGYVVRVADAFDYKDFSTKVAKFVRPGHVTTDKHWMYQGQEN